MQGGIVDRGRQMQGACYVDQIEGWGGIRGRALIRGIIWLRESLNTTAVPNRLPPLLPTSSQIQ